MEALADPLPAVDGLNGKVSAFGGAVDGLAFYGAAGSVSLPLGARYGLQIDGIAGSFDSRFQGDVAAGGAATHLFWRDPSIGMLGAYGAYLHTDAYGGGDAWAAAPEAAIYFSRFTVEGMAGIQGGEAGRQAPGNRAFGPRFFNLLQLSYYPTDNLKLSIGQTYSLGRNVGLVGAEWGFPTRNGTMLAAFATGSVAESGDTAILGGLRFYMGQRDKSLIRRHREDDPPALAAFGSSMGLGLASSGGNGGDGGRIGGGGSGGAGGY